VTIELTDWLRAELIRRAEAEAPNECCGLISRSSWADPVAPGRIHLWAAENASDRPDDSFYIATAVQLRILQEIEAQGQQLVGIYHSHPKSPPTPSPTDRVMAEGWPGVTWVIVGFPVCGRCGGAGDVPGDFASDASGGLMLCPDCGGADPVPDFWVGTLS
jgi:desampylase